MNDLVVSTDKQFSRALFGLNRNEVYMYLSKVSTSYEELQLQIQVLKDQNDKLSDSNRDNALKLYNIQGELTEAQRKTDKATIELEAALKQISALKKELADAERRIQKLTDELIKNGSEVSAPEKEPEVKRDPFTPKPIFDDVKTPEPPKEEPVKEEPVKEEVVKEDPIFTEPVKEEAPKQEEVKIEFKTETKTEPVKDLFADLRSQAAAEAKAEKSEPFFSMQSDKVVTPKPDTSTTSSANNFDDDEVYAGEVDIEIDESMLIGNDDDEDEGFNFL